mgnify:FL=1
MILEKSKVAKEILNKLKEKSDDNNVVILHTKEVHRAIIPDGLGSCSVDRYLRYMRKLGVIEYDDPRRNKYFYVIKIKEVI